MGMKRQLNMNISESTQNLLSELVARFREAHGDQIGIRDVVETAIRELGGRDVSAIKVAGIDRSKRGRPPAIPPIIEISETKSDAPGVKLLRAAKEAMEILKKAIKQTD